ncbi:DUF2934 domain-containing protein [Aureimonas leprariae]|uniref:DUF2934 domain-containing protein n=1 Tax=Plantimonas leprariae TaxID=2615207 RepID=A0A7V7TXQ0_9HYPH|nr:DUF2934 domain-containing protein [Aureimonas leprariae]KAB0675829.1 DUF2934 domain-containing protein [Aureimonas leprariae]
MAKLDRDEEVRRRAYFLWEKAGRPSGMEHHFWAEAAREIEGEEQEEQREPRSIAR